MPRRVGGKKRRLLVRIHQVSREGTGDGRIVIDAQVCDTAFFPRYVGPVEYSAGLHVAIHAEVLLENLGARGGCAKLGGAALQEWRTEGHMLRPRNGAVGGAEILERL